ncbi:MAG: hypothetical protein QME70_00310 [Bacillota bacterium]|nr:hypothetical protein [Bacillota bacterium]
MRSLKDMLARMFLGRRSLDWPGLDERAEGHRQLGEEPGREESEERGERAGGGLPPLRPDWRDIVAFTIAMYQILAVPFLLFCGVALFIYLLLWLWAR